MIPGRPPIQPGDKICGGAVIGELGDQIMVLIWFLNSSDSIDVDIIITKVCVAGGNLEFKSKKILEAGR